MEDLQSTQQVFLDFLSDEFLNSSNVGNGLLDNATLAAICNLGDTCGPSTSAAALKRPQEGTRSPEDSEDEDRQPSSKKCKGDAARNKANREKARREKMNDRFNELGRLIDPGKEPKTDKTSILADAIKYVQHINCENHQLKQLNKFLEERVSHYERDRGQALYQQSLALQGMGGSSMQSNMNMASLSGSHAAAVGSSNQPFYQPPHSQQHSQFGNTGNMNTNSGQGVSTSGPRVNASPFGQVSQPLNPPMQGQQQQPPGMLAHHLMQQQQQLIQQQQQQQQQERMSGMMSSLNTTALHSTPLPSLPFHPPPSGGYSTSRHERQAQLQQGTGNSLFPASSLHPDPEPTLNQQQHQQQHQQPEKSEDPQQQAQMMQPAAPVLPAHNLLGLKPALAWMNQPTAAAPTGLDLSREQPAPLQQQQPFWLSPEMLDSAHDSMLRPSLA